MNSSRDIKGKWICTLQVALTVNTAAAGAAAAVVSLAHSGNSSTNWLSICNQFGDFCQQTSGAVVGSFAAVLLFLLLILFSALSLKNRHWYHYCRNIVFSTRSSQLLSLRVSFQVKGLELLLIIVRRDWSLI